MFGCGVYVGVFLLVVGLWWVYVCGFCCLVVFFVCWVVGVALVWLVVSFAVFSVFVLFLCGLCLVAGEGWFLFWVSGFSVLFCLGGGVKPLNRFWLVFCSVCVSGLLASFMLVFFGFFSVVCVFGRLALNQKVYFCFCLGFSWVALWV